MEKSNHDIILELLNEFKIHRDAIMKMVGDLENLKVTIDKLFPERLDARYARFFEEKIKSATELFKTLLEMRKEIQKSLKEEIDLRRKINVDDEIDDIDSLIDIRSIASKVQEFQHNREKMRQKTLEKSATETDYIAEEIVEVRESG